jgi:hypothetical protein
MKKIFSLVAVFGLVPFLGFAARVNIFDIMTTIADILKIAVPILISLAVVYFIWNVIQYTIAGDEKVKEKAKTGIVQGLIGLFVIIAFWGIVNLVINTLGIGPVNPGVEYLPCVPNPDLGIYCD